MAQIPGPKARKVVERINKYTVPGTYAYPLVIKNGKGCYLQDVDGNWYLDFNANVCTAAVGYGDPEIMKCLKECAQNSAHKIAGQDFYIEEQADLAEKLLKIVPRPLRKVFFVNSGAEAIENAIKFAYREKGPLPGVSMKGAFHGRTLGALTFTHSKPVHKKNYPELQHLIVNFCTRDADLNVFEIDRVLAERDVAFVLTEVVQGEGGYNIASKRFLKNLRDVTKENGIPLILDEIQSGMGRTGEWWAFQHYKITPDVMTVAKSLQVGATITTESYNPNEAGAVGSTWGGGDRIDLAVGFQTIEIIERRKLLQNAGKMGTYFLKRLKEIEERYPKKLSNSRGLGLMLAVDFPNKMMRDTVEQEAFKTKLLLLGCGFTSIRFCPPLIISREEIDKGLDVFEKVVKNLPI